MQTPPVDDYHLQEKRLDFEISKYKRVVADIEHSLVVARSKLWSLEDARRDLIRQERDKHRIT